VVVVDTGEAAMVAGIGGGGAVQAVKSGATMLGGIGLIAAALGAATVATVVITVGGEVTVPGMGGA
jgi:hypothetical protein